MITKLTKEDLIAFEEDIADCFNKKQIRAPIHLYSGCEDQMIEVFQEILPEDWVLCSWRSHYQCLLKGVPKDKLKQAILDGKSISLCFPEYRVLSSAIVTGVLPIAVGLGLALKRSGAKNRVFCFVGDMTSETGIMNECFKYVCSQQLPVKLIIEDNNKSVLTDTRKAWGLELLTYEYAAKSPALKNYIYYYKYESKYPHAGVSGKRIQF